MSPSPSKVMSTRLFSDYENTKVGFIPSHSQSSPYLKVATIWDPSNRSFVRTKRAQTSQGTRPQTQQDYIRPKTQEGGRRPRTQQGGRRPRTQQGGRRPHTQQGITKPKTQQAGRRSKAQQGGKKKTEETVKPFFPCISYQEDNEGSFSGDVFVLRRILQRQAALDRLNQSFRREIICLCAERPAELLRPTTLMLKSFSAVCGDLDRATLNAVWSVQQWRKNFIGRKEFPWNGCNYINRIPADLDTIFHSMFQTDKIVGVPLKHAGSARVFIKQIHTHVGYTRDSRRLFMLESHGKQEHAYRKAREYILAEEAEYGKAVKNPRGEYVTLPADTPNGANVNLLKL